MDSDKPHIYINDSDIIEAEYPEILTAEFLAYEEVLTDDLVQKLLGENKPIKLLLNASKIKTVPPKTIKEGMKYFQQDDSQYEKMAYVFSSNNMRSLVNFLFGTMGQGKKVKAFSSREDALVWLLEEVEE